MKTLAEIYPPYSNSASWGDKNTVHSYVPVYERLLAPYRDTARRMLEIGILTGASLKMWEEYFHSSEVHGVDLCVTPLNMADLGPMIASGKHNISLFDASDSVEVEKHFGGVLFDVIVEDASHLFAHQMGMYYNFKRHLATGGIYIIEDVDEIDLLRPAFERIDPQKKVEIIDLRPVKGRFDDVLVVITDR